MLEQISALLAPHGVRHFGVCRFADCLPLLSCRAALRLPEQTRSVIMCLFPYHIGPEGDSPRRNVARYAVLPDYHAVVGGILAELAEGLSAAYPTVRFVPFVDSSPIREVHAAALAGLGVVGLNGQLIHAEYGCRVFLGAIATTAKLPASRPLGGNCLLCGRCRAACPTGALAPDKPFDQTLCRSFITQKKGELTPWQREQVRSGGLVWGCDLCVDACPMGSGAVTPIRAFHENPAPELTAQNLTALLTRAAYGYRGRAVLERNLQIIGEPATPLRLS